MDCPNCGTEISGENFCENCGSKVEKDYLATLTGRPRPSKIPYYKPIKQIEISNQNRLKRLLSGIFLADQGILNEFVIKDEWGIIQKIHLVLIGLISLISYLYYFLLGKNPFMYQDVRIIWGFYLIQIVSSGIFAYSLKISGKSDFEFNDYWRMMLAVSLASFPFLFTYAIPILVISQPGIYFFYGIGRLAFIFYFYYLILRIKIFYDFSSWRVFDAATIGSIALIVEFSIIMVLIA